jgi:hypothetical protein
LTYGNKAAASPNYDIDRFTDKVPTTLTTLDLGKELTLGNKQVQVTGPLFKNKGWLWTIIGLTIIILGWFTMKMMKKE